MTHAIRLLIVDDDDTLRQNLARRYERQGMSVTEAESAEAILGRRSAGTWDVALLDLHLPGIDGIALMRQLKDAQPDLECLLFTAEGSIETAIEAMRQGAYDYVSKPIPYLPELDVRLQKAAEKSRLVRRDRQWNEQLAYESPRYRLVGSSSELQRVIKLIERVAPTNTTVLIRGASGTGKELVARAIHLNSARRDQPMIAINCASLQETLLESELFGHEKGSFTGAIADKRGLIEVAEGGTLFVDEVAEMAPSMQARFLRVLEDGSYRRIGSTKESKADVRVIAATNKPLEEELKAGRFREDLYFRLNVLTIPLPALRERRSDVRELAEHFLASRQVGPRPLQLAPDVVASLERYDWPGNVRELANILERAQILAEGDTITLDDLPENLTRAQSPPVDVSGSPFDLQAMEAKYVRDALAHANNNRLAASRLLGISARTLYRMLVRYGIQTDF